jgi:hypothetical protein
MSCAALRCTYPLLCAIRISSRTEKNEKAGTHMYLIVEAARGLAIWEGAQREQTFEKT